MTKAELIKQIRGAVADYIASEGCSCCQSRQPHEAAHARLGELLEIPKDKDGYRSFWDYRTTQGKGESQ
jgi:hypothetical protein